MTLDKEVLPQSARLSSHDEAVGLFYDAFISYGRLDSKAFAARLYHRLSNLGLRVWFDQNDIPLGVNYQKQIDEGIMRSHNFLFIISPHSVNSPYCRLEIEQALRFGKRIIPVMHVEEIRFTTWQARNPQGTPEQWQVYKESGRHSSEPNLHLEIRKINWVFCREGIDDFDTSFQGLLEIFQRDQDYVQQHTDLLTKANDWEQQQRQIAALLMGQMRVKAETWLRQRFTDRQPPCLPVALHLEYICESLKYAAQWKTQVFLSYSDRDREQQEHIRLSLMLRGITVWSSKTDIQSGKDFQAQINRGIENADNLVIVLSPQTLKSIYCLREIRYAFELNKRVIPLLVAPIDLPTADQVSASVPLTAAGSEDFGPTLARLHQLQFLDFTNPQNSEPYRQSLDKLLKRLQGDAQYFREHKELLVQAIKWERQQKNPSLLLRGSLLRYYDAWGKVAIQRPEQPPTALQQQFLAESLQHPVETTLDVYLVCAPEDLEFARKLNDTLQVQGKTTWFPNEMIKREFDLQEEAQRALEQSQNAVFILSSNWVNSAECQAALDQALALNKRIVPVIYQAVTTSQFPEALVKQPWVDFQSGSTDFLGSFGKLYRLLESEPEHVRSHTQLLIRTRAWEEAGREDSYLLRGQELAAAEDWLQQSEQKIPQPTVSQRQFIEASRHLPQRRIKVRSLFGSAVAMTVLVFISRAAGVLQPLELLAYDALLRLRPSEQQDSRFLLVTVDRDSGDWLREQMKAKRYQPGIGTVPDEALAETLNILSSHNPALIGLDFYRDFEADPKVAKQLQQTDNLIGICKASAQSETSAQGKGVEKPPEVPIARVGFNDFVRDGAQHVRRQYLKKLPDPKFCNTSDAFSLLLARLYLSRQGFAYVDPWQEKQDRAMQLGPVKIPQLQAEGLLVSQSAGYTPLRFAALNGYQSMINFRAYRGSAMDFAESVRLEELLQGQVARQKIEGRIVLIGYTDRTDPSSDYYNTPYGEMPGLVVQGQMISQLLSAAANHRPLIWWWPIGGETLWILGWATAGGIAGRWITKPRHLALIGIGGSLILVGVCYGILTFSGGWVPLVPAVIAGLTTGSTITYLNYRLRHP